MSFRFIFIFLIVLLLSLTSLFAQECSTDSSKYIRYDNGDGASLNTTIWLGEQSCTMSTNHANGTGSIKCYNGQAIHTDIGTDMIGNVTITFFASLDPISGTESKLEWNPTAAGDVLFTDHDGDAGIGLWRYYNGAWTNTQAKEEDYPVWILVKAIQNHDSGKMNLILNDTSYSNLYTYSYTDSTSGVRFRGGDTSAQAIYIDTFMMWNRSIYGDECPKDNVLTISDLVNYTSNRTYFTFSFYVSAPSNCSLYTNQTSWSIKQSLNPGVSGTYNFTPINFPGDGQYMWSINCTDGTTGVWSLNYTFSTINTDIPEVQSYVPVKHVHGGSGGMYSGQSYAEQLAYNQYYYPFFMNFSASDKYLYKLNVSFYNLTDRLWFNESNATGRSLVWLNDYINLSAYAYGNYTIETCANTYARDSPLLPTYSISTDSVSKVDYHDPADSTDVSLDVSVIFGKNEYKLSDMASLMKPLVEVSSDGRHFKYRVYMENYLYSDALSALKTSDFKVAFDYYSLQPLEVVSYSVKPCLFTTGSKSFHHEDLVQAGFDCTIHQLAGDHVRVIVSHKDWASLGKVLDLDPISIGNTWACTNASLQYLQLPETPTGGSPGGGLSYQVPLEKETIDFWASFKLAFKTLIYSPSLVHFNSFLGSGYLLILSTRSTIDSSRLNLETEPLGFCNGIDYSEVPRNEQFEYALEVWRTHATDSRHLSCAIHALKTSAVLSVSGSFVSA